MAVSYRPKLGMIKTRFAKSQSPPNLCPKKPFSKMKQKQKTETPLLFLGGVDL